MAENSRRRNTPQRTTILAALQAMKSHPTATELYATVKHQLPRISLGTVYRNLEVLREDGLVRKIEFGAADARFDGCLEPHDHVRCTVCGALRDVEPPSARPRLSAPDDAAGFEVKGYQLEFFGVCPTCQEQDADREMPVTN